MSLEQIASYGFKSIYIVCGHNPLATWAKPVAIAFARASSMAGQAVTINCGGEYDAAGLKLGDHGGKWETSITMAIDSEIVDLEELRSRPDFLGVGCGDDALESSAEQGSEWIEKCASAIARDARWLVDNYPNLPGRMTK